ncbi:MAG: hypothetical protein HKP30_05955 [Myxococcales bacterium]|nr:hypothetical protein [Myxococcales bacterium]
MLPPHGTPSPLPQVGPKAPNVLTRPPTPGARPPKFDYDKLEEIIRDASNDAWWRDNVWWQVFGGNGGSCVDASESRSSSIADGIRGAVLSGELNLRNHTIRVGVRSGYQVGGLSIHTYSVIEVRDANGNSVRTIEVDNYVLPIADIDSDADTLPIGRASPVDWSDPSQQAESQHTIGRTPKPRPK